MYEQDTGYSSSGTQLERPFRKELSKHSLKEPKAKGSKAASYNTFNSTAHYEGKVNTALTIGGIALDRCNEVLLKVKLNTGEIGRTASVVGPCFVRRQLICPTFLQS